MEHNERLKDALSKLEASGRALNWLIKALEGLKEPVFANKKSPDRSQGQRHKRVTLPKRAGTLPVTRKGRG